LIERRGTLFLTTWKKVNVVIPGTSHEGIYGRNNL
jgi:hypothetical protein